MLNNFHLCDYGPKNNNYWDIIDMLWSWWDFSNMMNQKFNRYIISVVDLGWAIFMFLLFMVEKLTFKR